MPFRGVFVLLGADPPLSVVCMRSHVRVVSLLPPSDLESHKPEFLSGFLNGRKRLKLRGEEFLATSRPPHICSFLFGAELKPCGEPPR